jgi:N-acetylmuramoyl-L-alanine amidase
MKIKKLVIMAGHNTHAKGVGFFNSYGEENNEHDLVKRLCLKAFEELKEKYGDIVDIFPFGLDVSEKSERIKQLYDKEDIAIEFHCNSFKNSDTNGTEVFYDYDGIRSYFLARKISSILSKRLGTKNRGPKSSAYSHHGYLEVVDNTDPIPLILAELGFITNSGDLYKVNVSGRRAIYFACEHIIKTYLLK